MSCLRSMPAVTFAILLLASAESGLAEDRDVCTARTDLKASIDACTRILEQEYRDATRRLAVALKERATALAGNREFGRALADLTQAIGADPSFTEAYQDRGDLYSTAGRCEQAVADYNKIIELSPQNAKAHLGRGACRISKGEEEIGLADIDAAIKLDPSNRDGVALRAWNAKGRVHFSKRDFDAALADFDAAIKLDPKLAALHVERAHVLFGKGDSDNALA